MGERDPAASSVFQPRRAPTVFLASAHPRQARSNSFRLPPRSRGIWTPNSAWKPRPSLTTDDIAYKTDVRTTELLPESQESEAENPITLGPPLPTGSAILYEDYPTLGKTGTTERSGSALLHTPEEDAVTTDFRSWHATRKRFLSLLNSGQTWLPPRATLVTDHLVLGGFDAAADLALLQSLGVTHVLNAAGLDTPPHLRQRSAGRRVYLELPAHDSPHYDMSQHFRRAHAFIQQARASGGRVLVHCQAGINRSSALVLAHLLLVGHDLLTSTTTLRATRGMFLTNPGFQQQLLDLAHTLHVQ